MAVSCGLPWSLMNRRASWTWVALAAGILAIERGSLGGAVVTDGTVGAAGAIAPANGIYSIPATLGQTRGANLFHSLSRLDLDTVETASFSGPTNIQNVLA